MMKTTFQKICCLFLLALGYTETFADPIVQAQITIGDGAKINVVGHNSSNPTYTTILDCDGHIDVQGILDLDENATIKIAGDFITKLGTNIQRGNSTVIMDGNSPQEIMGDPSISGTIAFGFYNLTINNTAGVTINTTKISTLRVYAILDPKAGIFTTNQALILDAFSATNYARVAYGAGTFVGDVRVEKKLSNTNAQWRHLSMPLDETWNNGDWGSTIDLLFDNHTPAAQRNAFYWNALKNPSTTDDAYGLTAAPSTTNYTVPLAIYSNGGSSIHNVEQTFSCKGKLVSAASNVFSLEYTRDPADNPPTAGTDPVSKGWNFLPNPWPSLIDVQVLLSAASFQPDYKAVHVFNSFTGTYDAILLDNTVTKINYGSVATTIADADANIPPFQAFWVKANTTGQTVTLDRATMQTTVQKNKLNEQFMKAAPEVIRLNVFDQDSLWDQIVIYFKENGTRNFDYMGDAYYLKSPSVNHPEFFAFEGGTSASIVARQPNLTDSVDVVFKSTKNQSKFYINADLRELPVDWHVYLKDKKAGETIELSHGMNVSFTHEIANDSKRFEIYFSKMPEAFSNLVDQRPNEVFAFIRNEKVTLQSVGVSGPATIQVFDAVGRLLQKQVVEIGLGEEQTLDIFRSNQLLIIQIVVNGEVFVEKLQY